MKEHSVLKSIFVSTVSVSLLGTSFFIIPGANAELAAPSAGSSSAPLATEEVYCDAICPTIANSNGQLFNTSGTIGWTTTDDQWCANHNSQTNPSVMASPAPLGATVPTGSCTIAYYPGDTSCAQVTAGFNLCQYHNSQVQTYCQAYESAKMAGEGEKMVLMLDIAATGVCAADCMATSALGGTGSMACEASSTAAGAAEIVVTLTQQSSTMGKIADLALGGAGVALGLRGLMDKSSINNSCKSPQAPQQLNINGSNPLQLSAPPASVQLPQAPMPNLPGGSSEYKFQSVDDFLASLFISNAEASMSSCKKNACITAVAMAALTGVRYYNMGYGARTKASSCNNIWNLQSSASAVAGGITAAGYTAAGGSIAATSGSSTGTTGTTGTTNAATGTSCTAANISSSACGQVSAATDGGILANSGLGNAVAPLAQQLANSGLPSSLGSGGLGGGMGGAMSGAGDMGAALTKVAQTAADNGKELSQVASMGYSSGGGGGGSTASDTNAFANLLGGSGGAGPIAAPMAVFKGDGEDSDDIWHSHSSNNIFQIVSHRIGKVNP
jgi:hypothetical protein